MADQEESTRLIPPHGGYRELQSYRMAEIVLDATVVFCDRYIDRRSRTHLTLEHLLYAVANHPAGEEILRACAVDLDRLRGDLARYLEDSVERLPKGCDQEPAQTLAFRRVLQTAVLHVQSAGREEAHIGDVLAAILQQPRSQSAQMLAAQGVTRLDILNYISHGVSKVPRPEGAPEGEEAAHAGAEEAPEASRDPLQAYAVNLTERARSGQLDPLIGRQAEIQRALEVLCRRRKNNPVFVGDAGVGKTAMVTRASPSACCRTMCPRSSRAPRSTPHLSQQVTLIGHSLGTMVSRYYIERLGGKSRVEHIMLLGGPHAGAVKGLTSLLVAPNVLPFGLMGERLRQVVMTFASAYQIIPPYPCGIDQNGQEINFLEDERWVPPQHLPLLRAGREFRKELAKRASSPAVCIFGYGIKTITDVRLQREAGGTLKDIVYSSTPSGDSSILERSAVLEGADIHPVQQYHGSLFVDNDVKMRLKVELARQFSA